MPGIKHTCLEDCTNLNKLYVGLSKEKKSLLKQAVTENRFSELTRDDKQLVQKMNVEIEEFKQYLDILRNAIFLNKYIKMVQDTTTCKMRNVYLQLSGTIGASYNNTVEEFLQSMLDVCTSHDFIHDYLLTCVHNNSWAICTSKNEHFKYRKVFQYIFQSCDFKRPLVLRNPDMHVDNACSMFCNMVNIRKKLEHSVAYSITCQDLLWLGKKQTKVAASKSKSFKKQR